MLGTPVFSTPLGLHIAQDELQRSQGSIAYTGQSHLQNHCQPLSSGQSHQASLHSDSLKPNPIHPWNSFQLGCARLVLDLVFFWAKSNVVESLPHHVLQKLHKAPRSSRALQSLVDRVQRCDNCVIMFKVTKSYWWQPCTHMVVS